MSNIQERETFVRSFRKVADELMEGKIDFDEFGLLQFLSLLANPHNGKLLTNYADLENKLRLNRDKVRYLCEKLKAKRKIWFELTQGQRGFTTLYIDRFPLSNNSYINIQDYVSEVVASIPKLKNDTSPIDVSVNQTEIGLHSEVSNKENDNENDNNKESEKEKEREKSLSQTTNETFLTLSKAFPTKEAFNDYLLKQGYPKEAVDRLRL